MDYNFHTHTTRCAHAEGSEREYIEKAIKAGIKVMGFSDHIPHVNPDGTEYYYRVPVESAKEYASTINVLKEEYKGKIELYVGFETEYIPDCFDEMVENARLWGAEYLILGQHMVGRHPDIRWTVSITYDENDLKEYTECVVEAIKSGVITYVAHPDIINFVGDEKIYYQEMKKICIASKEYNVPLELNFLGIRLKRNYPCEKFWQIAGEVGCPVVFGFDAHDVEAAGDRESLGVALEYVEKFNLNLLKRPTIKRI